MNKAEVLKEIIEQRRSIFPKDYTEAEISQEVIDEILHSATLAPNHKRTKPWRFKIFKGEERQNWLQKCRRSIKPLSLNNYS